VRPAQKPEQRPVAPMCFASSTAVLKLLKSCRLVLHGSLVRAAGTNGKVGWRADTDKGPRWISLTGGKWTVSKVAPGAKPSDPVAA
jgi:hypothetical protein